MPVCAIMRHEHENYFLTHLYCHLTAEGLARGDGVPTPEQEREGMDA